MGMDVLMTCPAPKTVCYSRRNASAKAVWGPRMRTLAIVLTTLLLMVNGGRWLLQETPVAANELIVATCIVDAVYGDADPAGVCTAVRQYNAKESAR